MRKVLRVVGWSFVVLLLVGAFVGYRIIWGQPFTINQLANRQATFFLVRNPELFTMIGIADGTIVDRHSGKLAAVGIEKRDDDYAFAEQAIADVKKFDRAKLDPQEQITYDVLLDFYGSHGRVPAVRLVVVRGPVPDQSDVRHAGAACELPADVARREEREDRAQLRRAAAGDGRQARCAHRGDAAAVGGWCRAAVVAARALAGRDRRHDRAVAGGKPARHELRRSHGEGRGTRRHVAHCVARRGDRGRPDQCLPCVRADAHSADRRAAEGGGRGGRRRPLTRRRGLLPGDAAAVHDQRLHA